MKRLIFIVALVMAVSLALAACGGGAPPEAPYDPSVTPLTGADLENVSTIPNVSGLLPCGPFNVNGHGPKVVELSQFPNCSGGEIFVACLGADAKWTNDNVADLKVTASQVTFTSNQDGTCSLFVRP